MKRQSKYNRSERVLKLYLLIQCYDHFALMKLYSQALNSQVMEYEEAEKSSVMFNELLKVETKPDDFLTNDEVLSEKAIQAYEEYKKWAKTALETGYISDKNIQLFCESVELDNNAIYLKSFHMYLKTYMEKLVLYVFERITKDDFEKSFTDFTDRTGGMLRSRISIFKNSIRQIESLLGEIESQNIEKLIQNNDK